MKLSHSSSTMFMRCPKAFQFHYVNKLRPKTQNASLPFGTAVDKAVAALLECDEEGRVAVAKAVFDENWNKQEINKQIVSLPDSEKLVYSNSDFDEELLSKDDIKELNAYCHACGFEDQVGATKVYELIEKKKEVGFDNLTVDEKKLLNYGSWLTMRVKGHLMIDSFNTKVLPKIRKVYSTQKEIKVENDDGDVITGFADMVCEVEGYGNVILDLKTAAKAYEEDSVLTSPQLSLYVFALENEYMTRHAGYIVLIKQVQKNRVKTCTKCGKKAEKGSRVKTCAFEVEGKRCGGEFNEVIDPEIPVQFIINEIPSQTEEVVVENFEYVNKAIKRGEFNRNFNSCTTPWRCPFWEKCYHGSEDNLITLQTAEVTFVEENKESS